MHSGLCHSCRRGLTTTVYVVQGYLGTYYECEYCFEGKPRPAEPEIILDVFEPRPEAHPRSTAAGLDAILDKLTGASG